LLGRDFRLQRVAHVDVGLYHLQKLLESTSLLQTLIIRQGIMFDRKEVKTLRPRSVLSAEPAVPGPEIFRANTNL